MNEQVNLAGDGWDDQTPVPRKDDDGRTRKIQVEGRDWILEARDPYGFWFVIDPTGGKVPTELSGMYTDQVLAEAGVHQYMTRKPVSPAKKEAVEQGTVPPVLKTKKIVQKPKVKEAV